MTEASGPIFDVIIRNGTVFDGSGGPPFDADIAISSDTIATMPR